MLYIPSQNLTLEVAFVVKIGTGLLKTKPINAKHMMRYILSLNLLKSKN